MTSRVRLLPVVICAATVLMSLKIGALASASSEPKAEEHPPAEAAAAAPAAEGATPADAPAGEAKPAAAAPAEPPPKAPEQAQTKGEAEVLRNLGERRAA